jgi:hypothetical protein
MMETIINKMSAHVNAIVKLLSLTTSIDRLYLLLLEDAMFGYTNDKIKYAK